MSHDTVRKQIKPAYADARRQGRHTRREAEGVDRGQADAPRRDRGMTESERRNGMKKTLAEAIKGMQVKSWEMREHSDGKRVVYVRFAPKEPPSP
jgi:hypothetical protein